MRGVGVRGISLDVTSSLKSAFAKPPSSPLWAFAGDSRTQNAFDTTGGSRNFFESRGAPAWARALCNHKFTIASATQYGVGGDTTTMLLARWSTVLADAALVIVMWIGTNDRGAANLSLQTTRDNINAMLTAALAANKYIIIANDTPRNDGLTAPQQANHVAQRSWINGLPSVWPNVRVWDTWSAIEDPNNLGYPVAAYLNADLLHINTEGGYRTGIKLAAVADAMMLNVDYSRPWVSGESTNRPALNLNPGLTGTAGTLGTVGSVTGQIATSWRGDFNSGSTSMVVVCSKDPVDDSQIFTFSGTSAAASTFTFRPSAFLGLAAGAAFDFRARIALDANSVGILGVTPEARADGTTTVQSRGLDGYQDPDRVPAVGFNLHTSSPLCVPASGVTNTYGSVIVTFAPSTTISAVVRVKAAASRLAP